jgi:formylglycine-generating enzyme required for sulfatase activity
VHYRNVFLTIFLLSILAVAASICVPALAADGPLSLEREHFLKPGQSFRECDACPVMVMVPYGVSFTMGSPDNELDRDPELNKDESPQHSVKIARPFAVGKFHVTRDQFAAFVGETKYNAGSECYTVEDGKVEKRSGRSFRNPGFAQNGSHPAVCLNWDDAKAYVGWLSRKTGKAYRLLTEAEWEYAARGRTSVGLAPRFFYGNAETEMCRYGNVGDGATKKAVPNLKRPFDCNDGYAYTAPVGSFAANPFGLFDMHGNAWVWTEDCYHDSYIGAPADGSAWATGDCKSRVLRGGSWFGYPGSLRAAMRSGGPAGSRNYRLGLRVARTLTP